ncbi:hypothetical protein GPALN_003149 [Globodera pallida]|nr:hypothetical protein GPALN_003149 [Globodera pallida]
MQGRSISLLARGGVSRVAALSPSWQVEGRGPNFVAKKSVSTSRPAYVAAEAATSQPSTPKAAVTDEVVNITYVTRNGTEKRIQGKIGDNVMYLAHDHNIEIEGACEASLACCTCHVYVDENFYNKLPAPVEDEEDMLDMAPLLKPNSRLSCQIILNKELDGIKVTLPNITRNFYVDGHVPEPH